MKNDFERPGKLPGENVENESVNFQKKNDCVIFERNNKKQKIIWIPSWK